MGRLVLSAGIQGSLLQLLIKELAVQGYLLASASAGEDISSVIDEVGDKLDAAIVSLGEPTDADMLSVISAKIPDCPVILILDRSGEKFIQPSGMNISAVLYKPYSLRELLDILETIMKED